MRKMGSEKLNDLPKVTHPGSDREDREDDTHFPKGRRVVKMALGRLHSKDFFFLFMRKIGNHSSVFMQLLQKSHLGLAH